MTRRERSPLLLLVVLLGVGLLTAAYAIWTLEANVRQQQQTVAALLDQSERDRQALSEQQQLVRLLQGQVLKLGGTPVLTVPATPQQRPSAPSSGGVPSATPTRSAGSPRPTPARTPRPTGSPSQSPTPTPSPSASCAVKIGPICL